VILVYLGGGLSQLDSFDPKPAASEEVRGKYRTISSAIPGLAVGELLPRTAQLMNRVALVRSCAHGFDTHEGATNWVLSGRLGSLFGDYPAMGAVVAHEFGFRGALPPHVAIPQNPSFSFELGKSAYLGGRYESFKAGDPNLENYSVRDVTQSEMLSPASCERRQVLAAAVNRLGERVQGNDQVATYEEFQRRAAALIFSGEGQRAFAIDQEPAPVRERYGRSTFGQSCLLARRLIERGVRFATVNYGGWDHHFRIFEGLDKQLPPFDQGFSALVEDLGSRGLLAETLVLVLTEFGRSPKVNKDTGRDHWPPSGVAVFAGAGIKAGAVLGRTDKISGAPTERPVSPTDMARTVYELLGIDPHKALRAPDGRPIDILDGGESIKEILT
jgi:hypothetical protein